jgi:hypothetical protein
MKWAFYEGSKSKSVRWVNAEVSRCSLISIDIAPLRQSRNAGLAELLGFKDIETVLPIWVLECPRNGVTILMINTNLPRSRGRRNLVRVEHSVYK